MRLKGKTREALQVLQDALDECTRWGELDVQGLLMFEGAKLEVQRGKTGNGAAMLKVPRANAHTPDNMSVPVAANWIS